MIQSSPSRISASLALTRILLQAMGIAGSAGALGATACSGSVVVMDSDPGGGGSGGGDSVTSSDSGITVTTNVTSTGTGSSWCDVEPPTDGSQLIYACMNTTPEGSDCPPADDATLLEDLRPGIESQGLGCGGPLALLGIACGPDPSNSQCCYQVQGYPNPCGGRPFVVNGSARTARIAARTDWHAALPPDLLGLDDEDRALLADAWARDALDEHASVASFARFVLELLAVGAPPDLVREAQRAMGDEIAHAELCFGLAAAYAGAGLGPSGMPMPSSLSGRTTLAEVAAAVVREGCVGETLAAFGAIAARDAATDPAVRGALVAIVDDETAHAALAWRFVAWALAQGGAGVLEAVESAFAGTLAAPMEAWGDGGAPVVDPAREVRLRAHGRLSDEARRAAFDEALRDVVKPCARALLSGAGATANLRTANERDVALKNALV